MNSESATPSAGSLDCANEAACDLAQYAPVGEEYLLAGLIVKTRAVQKDPDV